MRYEIIANLTFNVTLIVDSNNKSEAQIRALRDFSGWVQLSGEPSKIEIISTTEIITEGKKLGSEDE